MSEKFLHRSDAPFEKKVWEIVDNTVRSAAIGQLCARRLLHTEGPYGYGLKVIPGADHIVKHESGDNVVVSASNATPVAAISADFSLQARDIEAFEESGTYLDLQDAVTAALRCARKEDGLIFYGSKELGVEGLVNSKGVQSVTMQPWKEVGDAVENVIAAVDMLDKAGFHGPYSLALAPSLYNHLFRRYPQGNTLEIEHLGALVSDGIVKAPSLQSGGVLVASGRQYASVVVGQDLMTGFEGPEGRSYNFFISESIALRLRVPSTVCVLKAS